MTSLDQHTGVVGELARAHRRIAELERREALLTADLLAHMAFLEARKDVLEEGSDDDWIHEVDGPFVVATHRLSQTHTALTEAGFPWAPEAGE